eukprot:2506994-Amphidinium_carterae.1
MQSNGVQKDRMYLLLVVATCKYLEVNSTTLRLPVLSRCASVVSSASETCHIVLHAEVAGNNVHMREVPRHHES